ncbi:hypothetical protein FRC09_014888 [Ceratobasidium sp. 395]|nr:hypothetical protein FRC09_014888 [Ceratobasidium sp. 395]
MIIDEHVSIQAVRFKKYTINLDDWESTLPIHSFPYRILFHSTMNTTPEGAIPFDVRAGAWQFHNPTLAMAYAGQIVRWAHMSQIPLHFEYRRVGREHAPCWIAQPIVNEEALGPAYFGYGVNKQEAKEAACRKMAFSGHCVSDTGFELLFKAKALACILFGISDSGVIVEDGAA